MKGYSDLDALRDCRSLAEKKCEVIVESLPMLPLQGLKMIIHNSISILYRGDVQMNSFARILSTP